MRVPSIVRGAMSFCAIVAFSLVWSIASYFGWFAALSMKSDSYPPIPSYLQGGAFCGHGSTPACPSQYLHRLNDKTAP